MHSNLPRKYPRIPCANVVHIINPASSGQDLSIAITEDVSVGGCLLQTHAPLGIGRVLLMRIGLGITSVRVIGKVLRERVLDNQVVRNGIEFVSMDPEDEDALYSFIGERMHSM